MLDRLYKKLHIIFTCGIMLIISAIIAIVINNNINKDRSNEKALFQRMATLIMYQCGYDDIYFEKIIESYEQKHGIVCIVKTEVGETLYMSPSEFPTSTEFLLNALEEQKRRLTIVEFADYTVTVPNDTFEISGQNNDAYLAIYSIVASDVDKLYDWTLLYKSKTTLELLLSKQTFLYILIWFAALICVVFLSRLTLKKALAPTERVLKSQRDFVASASHELKSPLALILANVEKIGKLNIENSDLDRSVKAVDTECMRMSQLVNDMLLLASSDAQTWSVSKQEINVDTLLIALYETYQPICSKHNIALELDITGTSYPALYSDPERLTQVLSIFLDNAISHSRYSPSIQIKTLLTAKTVTFYIVDHGDGVAEKDKPYIFDRFYCADKSHTDKSHFGLGLSIAGELTKKLNGKIGFEDTADGGATFFITIPLR